MVHLHLLRDLGLLLLLLERGVDGICLLANNLGLGIAEAISCS